MMHVIVLNYSAFIKYLVEYKEISSYPIGYKENWEVFFHSNPGAILGETIIGRRDCVWD